MTDPPSVGSGAGETQVRVSRPVRLASAAVQASVVGAYGLVGWAALTLAAVGVLWGPLFGQGPRYFVVLAELAGFGSLLVGGIYLSYRWCFLAIRSGQFAAARRAVAVMAAGNAFGALGGLAISFDLLFFLALPIAIAYAVLYWCLERSGSRTGPPRPALA